MARGDVSRGLRLVPACDACEGAFSISLPTLSLSLSPMVLLAAAASVVRARFPRRTQCTAYYALRTLIYGKEESELEIRISRDDMRVSVCVSYGNGRCSVMYSAHEAFTQRRLVRDTSWCTYNAQRIVPGRSRMNGRRVCMLGKYYR